MKKFCEYQIKCKEDSKGNGGCRRMKILKKYKIFTNEFKKNLNNNVIDRWIKQIVQHPIKFTILFIGLYLLLYVAYKINYILE